MRFARVTAVPVALILAGASVYAIFRYLIFWPELAVLGGMISLVGVLVLSAHLFLWMIAKILKKVFERP